MRTRRQALDEFRARIAAENRAAAGVELAREPATRPPSLVSQGVRSRRQRREPSVDDLIRAAAHRGRVGWERIE